MSSSRIAFNEIVEVRSNELRYTTRQFTSPLLSPRATPRRSSIDHSAPTVGPGANASTTSSSFAGALSPRQAATTTSSLSSSAAVTRIDNAVRLMHGYLLVKWAKRGWQKQFVVLTSNRVVFIET